MKVLLAMVSGFVLTLAIFGGGALTAIYLINADRGPARTLDMDTSALWTNKPVPISGEAQGLQRGRAQETPQEHLDAQPAKATASMQAIDVTTTSALSAQPAGASAAHVQWCLERYRSYDRADNSYTAYSGARRICVSPYSESQLAEERPQPVSANAAGDTFFTDAGAGASDPGSMNEDHIRSCFARYRSYRVQDNTYQPYGGGPRRQCE